MNFIKNGTVVRVMNSEFKATVIGVCIRGIENCTIEYHVQWVNGSEIKSEWLYDYQVVEFIETRKKAGMVNYETGIDVIR